MISNLEMKLNEDQDKLCFCVRWEVSLKRIDCENLTEAQRKALKNYCNDLLPKRIATADLDRPITITPCEIFRINNSRSDPKVNGIFYDAETGELYSKEAILNGNYEIRIKPTGS